MSSKLQKLNQSNEVVFEEPFYDRFIFCEIMFCNQYCVVFASLGVKELFHGIYESVPITP